MLDRRYMIAALAGAAVMNVANASFASETHAYDAKAFQAAQAAGKPTLIEVTAPWCPTCKAQKPILSELGKKPKFKDLVVFQVDFDSQKELLRKFNVRAQSTLISYKGTNEVARSTGETDPSAIERQLDKSV